MSILHLQKAARLVKLGNLRLGYSTPGRNGGKTPKSTTKWVISSPHRHLAEAVASRYGGEVQEWEQQFRVFTTASALPVYVLPFEPSQWLEVFDEKVGRVVRRCDGETCRVRTERGWINERCRCDLSDASLAPECGARTTSRFEFILPELPAMGVWLLTTHGYHAAVEMPTMMQYTRIAGQLVAPAELRIERRQKGTGTSKKVFVVPVLHPASATHLLPGQAAPALGAGSQAQQLLARNTQEQDDAITDAEFSDVPDGGYTEREFSMRCSDMDLAPQLRTYLASLRPPSLDALDQLAALHEPASLLAYARTTGCTTWAELMERVA